MISTFATARLVMRPVDNDDLELLAELNRDPVVMEFLATAASSIDGAADELEAAVGNRWLAFARTDRAFLGWVGAVPTSDGSEFDIGWRFIRAAWGHGYATEAARVLIDRLFDNGAQRVLAQTMAVNTRSRAVMDRLGLQHRRTFILRSMTHSRAPRREKSNTSSPSSIGEDAMKQPDVQESGSARSDRHQAGRWTRRIGQSTGSGPVVASPDRLAPRHSRSPRGTVGCVQYSA